MNFFKESFYLFLGNKVTNKSGSLTSAYEKGRLEEWYKEFLKFILSKWLSLIFYINELDQTTVSVIKNHHNYGPSTIILITASIKDLPESIGCPTPSTLKALSFIFKTIFSKLSFHK